MVAFEEMVKEKLVVHPAFRRVWLESMYRFDRDETRVVAEFWDAKCAQKLWSYVKILGVAVGGVFFTDDGEYNAAVIAEILIAEANKALKAELSIA